MSFEVKYDEKGNVISQPPIIEDQAPEIEQEANEEESQPEQVAQQAKQNDVQENFARLRQKAETAERERDELRRQIESLRQPQQPEEDLNIGLNDDELAEGRHLTKVDKKIQRLEAKLMQYEQINSQMAIENKLKQQYPDFDQIVSVANVQRMQEEFPEILQTIRSANDLYAQGVTAYTMIKKLGIVPDDMSSLQRINTNKVKPRPTASLGVQQGASPLSKANPFAEGLTTELKDALLKEMNQAIRGS